MKLSKNTIEILKNFCTINKSMVIKPGTILRIKDTSATIYAEAMIEESFDREVGIYDLGKFLSVLSLNKDIADISLSDDSFQISSGKGVINLRYSNPETIKHPNKTPGGKGKEYKIKFSLSEESLKWMFNTASVLSCPNVLFQGGKEGTHLLIVDSSGAIVDSARSLIDETPQEHFDAKYSIQHMKMLPGNYTVELDAQKLGLSRFTNKDRPLIYFLGYES